VLIGVDASRAVTAQRTGTETYSLRLIQAMLDLGSGHRFRLYTNGRPPAGLFAEFPAGGGTDSSEAEVRSIPFPRLWTHFRLSAEVLVRPPDVLFVPAHVLPLVHARRCVATVHDLGFLHFPEAHRRWDRRYLAWATGWNARQSTVVIADSRATRTDLLREHRVQPSRVRVVHLGRDESLAPVRDPVALDRVRARYEIGPRYLLYVGTLQPRKNLGRVIEAFARLAGLPGMEEAQLILAGKRGWLYEDLFVQVSRLGLEGRVRFPGYADHADLAALYSGATGFVFPSLYEGFGMPVLEAQSCGVPVMTSNNSSLPEIAGDAALLVDPHDVDAIAAAMLRLATDDALRAELVERGLANAQRFSWEKCARETLAVLESVVGERSGGKPPGGTQGA
jgi:glycosyltransferase involved in cell wall biosynthesis